MFGSVAEDDHGQSHLSEANARAPLLLAAGSGAGADGRPRAPGAGEAPEQEERRHERELERALLERIVAGDRPAFAELVRRYQKKVFAVGYGFFRDRDEALDIVQETFMRVHDKIGSFRPEGSLQAWIFRLAHNLCIDRYRKRGGHDRRECGLEEAPERELAVHSGPQEAWRRQRRQEAIEAALDRLSPRQRSLFALKYRQGLTLQQAAGAMAVSLGTAKALHHRALGRLRREMAAWSGGEHE